MKGEWGGVKYEGLKPLNQRGHHRLERVGFDSGTSGPGARTS